MSDAIVWMALLLYNAKTMSAWHSFLDENEDKFVGLAKWFSLLWSAIIYVTLSWCSAKCVVAFAKLVAEAVK